ncbi:MAG: ChbG/HpnK family deacetylase, partial [Planctomycetaceae bacterium]
PAAARDAADNAAAAGFTDLGLHIDLGECAYHDGAWRQIAHVVDTADAAAVAAECRAQLDIFRDLVGRDPTHLDSHQHVHRDEPVRQIALDLAAELGVPLRHFAADVAHCGGFYGQTGRGEPAPGQLTVAALVALLHDEAAKTDAAAIEVGCHPGWDADLDTMYRAERPTEVEVLCDPALRAALADIGLELGTFAGLDAVRDGKRAGGRSA